MLRFKILTMEKLTVWSPGMQHSGTYLPGYTGAHLKYHNLKYHNLKNSIIYNQLMMSLTYVHDYGLLYSSRL
jgi:hypothetical protein